MFYYKSEEERKLEEQISNLKKQLHDVNKELPGATNSALIAPMIWIFVLIIGIFAGLINEKYAGVFAFIVIVAIIALAVIGSGIKSSQKILDNLKGQKAKLIYEIESKQRELAALTEQQECVDSAKKGSSHTIS